MYFHGNTISIHENSKKIVGRELAKLLLDLLTNSTQYVLWLLGTTKCKFCIYNFKKFSKANTPKATWQEGRPLPLPYAPPAQASTASNFCEILITLHYIKSWHLSLFRHVACMNGKADMNKILFQPTLELWRRTPGQHVLPGSTSSLMICPPLTRGWWRRGATQNRVC